VANPSKAKGTAKESAARDWLISDGWLGCRRQPLSGNRDQGDLMICDKPERRIVAEVKYRDRPVTEKQIWQWLDQTEDEAVHAGADLGVLIVAVKGRPPAMWEAWMIAADWIMLLTGDTVLPCDAPWPMRTNLADWSNIASDWADQ
jgi:hypothetical protein